MRTLAERFWEKVDRNGPIAPHMTTSCWIWTGAIYKDSGYGAFRDGEGRTRNAHRIGFTIQTGEEVPPSIEVLHHCDVRRCIRGDHLFLGSQKDNVDDAITKGRAKPPPILAGTRNGNSRLTDAIVTAIRHEYACGARQVALAAKFGVSQAAISKIVRGEWWKHLL